MSWEAVIMKINGPFRPIGEVADEDFLPLGSIESVAERIRAAFPGAEWSSPTWANWGLDDMTGVTIDLGPVESDNMVMLSVSGSGNPVPHLQALARANDWVVLDCGSSEFLNPDDDGSSEGWAGYQSLMGGLAEPISGSEDQAPLQTAPQTPPPPLAQSPPLVPPQAPPPRTRKKKKAAKKVERKVMRKGAAKKSRPRKKSAKKKTKSPKKNQKKGLKKKSAKKTLKKKSPGKKRPKKKK